MHILKLLPQNGLLQVMVTVQEVEKVEQLTRLFNQCLLKAANSNLVKLTLLRYNGQTLEKTVEVDDNEYVTSFNSVKGNPVKLYYLLHDEGFYRFHDNQFLLIGHNKNFIIPVET